MQKILRKRILRDFKENIARYVALSFLIILSMYLVVSLVGAADTIIQGTDRYLEDRKAEDGQFSLFVPMKEREWEDLTEEGITLEKMFSLDYVTKDDKTIRVYRNRKKIDLMALVEGREAQTQDEVVLERQFCEKNGITVGDTIELGGHSLQVCGIGSVPDYDSPLKSMGDTGCDSLNFGLAFVEDALYDKLLAEEKSAKAEEYYYAYRLNGKMTDEELKKKLEELTFTSEDVNDPYFQEYWDRTYGKKDEITQGMEDLTEGSEELSEGLDKLSGFYGNQIQGLQAAADGAAEVKDGMTDLKKEAEDMIDEVFDQDAGNLLTFVKAEDNVRIHAAADDQELNRNAGKISGVIVLILIAYVLSVFVVHSIDKESAVIGALYALGVKRRDLMAHYIMLPSVLAFISGAIGTGIAYTRYGVLTQMQDCYNYYSLPDFDVVISGQLVLYGVIVPPVVSMLVTGIVIRKRLSRPVLSLLRNETKVTKGKNIRLGKMDFMHLFKLRQLIRERRTALTVVFGMFVSFLLLIMALEIYVYCDHVHTQYVEDTKYEYMYTYKYPTKRAPEGGYKAYAKSLKKEIYGYHFDVTMLGITEDNPFFDVKTKDLQDQKDQVVISSSIAYKYGLGVGDILTLRDEEEGKIYAFEITGITQYAPSFMVFMPYENALELFGEQDDFYNVVFSDHALSIPSGRLAATTTREDVKKAAGIFSDQMQGMIYTIGGVSIVIFVIVLYLMMKVMIDRSSFHIALIKIFGFRNREVRKMYLDANFYVVVLGALLSIPLAKWIMDAVYEPFFVSNIACGVDKIFTPAMYGCMFAGTLLLYFVIDHLLVYRIKQMLPAEVLKNRE